MMDITGKVFLINGDGNIKAMASITLDNSFVVGGLKVMNGSKGLFVSMPSRKLADGTYKDSCFPLSKDVRQQINDVVLAAYEAKASNESDEQFEEDDELPF